MIINNRTKQFENLRKALNLKSLTLWLGAMGGAVSASAIMSLWLDNSISTGLLIGIGFGSFFVLNNFNYAWHGGGYNSETKLFDEPVSFRLSHLIGYIIVLIVSFCGPMFFETMEIFPVLTTAILIMVVGLLSHSEQIKIYLQNTKKELRPK